MEFRRGLLYELTNATGSQPRQQWDRDSVADVAKALAEIKPNGPEF
jgi:hypothetical protein